MRAITCPLAANSRFTWCTEVSRTARDFIISVCMVKPKLHPVLHAREDCCTGVLLYHLRQDLQGVLGPKYRARGHLNLHPAPCTPCKICRPSASYGDRLHSPRKICTPSALPKKQGSPGGEVKGTTLNS